MWLYCSIIILVITSFAKIVKLGKSCGKILICIATIVHECFGNIQHSSWGLNFLITADTDFGSNCRKLTALEAFFLIWYRNLYHLVFFLLKNLILWYYYVVPMKQFKRYSWESREDREIKEIGGLIRKMEQSHTYGRWVWHSSAQLKNLSVTFLKHTQFDLLELIDNIPNRSRNLDYEWWPS